MSSTKSQIRRFTILFSGLVVGACTLPAETQALIDEYNRTIPTCQDNNDCQAKWDAARQWVVNTPSYGIRVSNDTLIETYNADSTRGGTGIQVDREPVGNDLYQIVVNVECYATIGCPPRWETMIDFNRVVNAAGN